MSKDEIIARLKAQQARIKSFGVKSLAIFGSVARNEAKPESDLDVLVEFEDKITFDRYMDFKIYLEDCLGMRVDLVSQKMLKPQIRTSVLAETINVT